jgi:hypothetical protein
MFNITEAIAQTKKFINKVDQIFTKKTSQGFTLKNIFNRLYVEEQFSKLLIDIERFNNKEMNPQEMLNLKNELQSFKMPQMHSKSDLAIAEEQLSIVHKGYLTGAVNAMPDTATLRDPNEHYTFLLLLRNIRQETRYRKSFKRMIKYVCRRIDSEFNKSTKTVNS